MGEDEATAMGYGIAAFQLQSVILALLVRRNIVGASDVYAAIKTAQGLVPCIEGVPRDAAVVAAAALHGLAFTYAEPKQEG